MALELGTNCGIIQGAAPTADPDGAQQQSVDLRSWAFRVSVPADATTVSEMGWYCNNATEEVNWEIGVYDHDSANSRPGTLLAGADKTNAKGTGAGWKVATGMSIDVSALAGGYAWLAIQVDDPATLTYIDVQSADGNYGGRKNSVATLPSPTFGAFGTALNNYLFAIYAICDGGAPAQSVIPVLMNQYRQRRN